MFVKPFTLFCFLLFTIAGFTVNTFALTENSSSRYKLSPRIKYVENKNQWEDFIRYEADFRGGKVFLENIYPGIDQQFYSAGNDVKYDFIVNPGASADNILLEYEGADKLSVYKGELHMQLSVGTIIEQNPVAYQLINSVETAVRCKFVL